MKIIVYASGSNQIVRLLPTMPEAFTKWRLSHRGKTLQKYCDLSDTSALNVVPSKFCLLHKMLVLPCVLEKGDRFAYQKLTP
ncbi:MAG: hypothetical protein KME31_34660 [Tolypothrix carrinoi HA7290-LM1]|jgi:hypothetical protein|nr:hypothetical protein [Tolypothrix carrinoi HA7290-LM1]